jgi:hypothetical protein
MRTFIRRHVDPGSRLGEVLFGLIMALGFTGAVRLGHEEANNRQLFLDILGCNVAWAIVDGVMFTLGALFERGRKARLVREILSAQDEDAALRCIGEELDGPLMALTTPDVRERIHRDVLDLVRSAKSERASLRRDDMLGGLAVACLIVLTTLPIIVPFLVVREATLAARLSHVVALSLLFVVGTWWGRVVGASPWRVGLGLTVVGMVLVLVTIALGG